MMDYQFSIHDYINTTKKILKKKNINDNKKEEKKMNLDFFIPDKILIQNFKTESSNLNNIYNKNNNNKKINSNTLSLDLSYEDINNSILNNNSRQDIYKEKCSINFNTENNDSILNQNELNPIEIKNQLTPSIIIDEESKSYIKEIIDYCKVQKGYKVDKMPKSNISKYIKGKPNLYYKDIKLKKEYYKNNGHVKKLKTEDLIKIAKRRRENLNKNRYNKVKEESKINSIKTEQNHQINIDNDNDIDIYALNKNKTNRIKIKKEYLSSFLKSNFNQINNNNNKRNKISINNNKINNINSFKNNLFYLFKQKHLNNLSINHKINFDENFNNKIKILCQYNNQISHKKFNNTNNDSKDKNNNIIKRNQTVLNKDLLITTHKNLLNENINIHDKYIKRNKRNRKKLINNKNLTNNIDSYKYAYINYNKAIHNFKNNYSKFYNLDNNSTNIFNFLNKKNNSRMYLYTDIYNFRKKICNHSSNKTRNINNKSANYLSAHIKNTNYMSKKESNLKNRNKAPISQKLIYTEKEYKKEKDLYKTLINTDIYERENNKNSLHNKSENILNIQEFKLSSKESMRLKKLKSNNVINEENSISPKMHHQLNEKNKFSFNNYKFDNRNFSIHSNSINYLYQKASDINNSNNNNNKLFSDYSPIKNISNNLNIININNQKHKYNYKNNISKKNYAKFSSHRKIDISVKNKENIIFLLNKVKIISEIRNKNLNIKEKDNLSNNNINYTKKNFNNINNYKGLIIKKNLYKKIKYNKYENIKKQKREN